MAVVHARITLDPDERERALALIEDVAEKSQAEPAVIDYRATTEIGDPNVVHIVEHYEDAAGLEAHMETEHYAELVGQLPEIAVGDIEGRTYPEPGEVDHVKAPIDEVFG